jgi:hypothetical protein
MSVIPWPNEIDGIAVLRRIIADGGRIRQTTINNSMIEAAQTAIARMECLDPELMKQIAALNVRLGKVLTARRRRL